MFDRGRAFAPRFGGAAPIVMRYVTPSGGIEPARATREHRELKSQYQTSKTPREVGRLTHQYSAMQRQRILSSR